MTLLGALSTRLREVLPAGVPVLLPEQQREPADAAPLDAQGRPVVGGGLRGLGLYLQQHPAGYVQVEQPLSITADDYVATYWTAVACVATTAAGAAELAEQVRRALCGTPDAPGPHRRVIPDSPRALAEGAYLVRPSYETTEIDGEFAV